MWRVLVLKNSILAILYQSERGLRAAAVLEKLEKVSILLSTNGGGGGVF
jgi:hypothetical protein